MMWFMITYMPMATALPVCVQKASETERVKLKGNALAAAAATDGAVRAAVQLISALNWLVVWCATRRFVLRYLFAPFWPLRCIPALLKDVLIIFDTTVSTFFMHPHCFMNTSIQMIVAASAAVSLVLLASVRTCVLVL